MNKNELLDLLRTTKAESENYFDLSNNYLAKKYGEGKWNVRQILHHITDTEILFYGRLKRIIAEPKQVIWAFNQDDWNSAFDYKNANLGNKKEVYKICRSLNFEIIDQFYEKYQSKEFVHSETGLRTLKDEFEKVAKHNESHNDQIKLALKM